MINHMNHPDSRQAVSQPRSMPPAPSFQTDPRQRTDPRVKAQQTMQSQPPQQLSSGLSGLSGLNNLGLGGLNKKDDVSDSDKAKLIMQVLALTDEQIAMLPAEQRTSILLLKEQIAKSTQR